MMATEVNGETSLEVLATKRGDGDTFRLELFQRFEKAFERLVALLEQEVDVAAKLRRAVQYARLTAHEQRSDATLAH